MTVSALNISVQGGYTTALEDLSTDENFNSEDYPLIEDDYSLQVIQIAESSEKELFVYVYQPSADSKNIVATSLFLSTNPRGLDYKNYYLSLINKNDVFYKYRVKNFVVSSATTRDYEITSIYRKFDETIDKGLEEENENIINEVEYEVARHWVFTTTDNGIEIGSHDIETIKITDKYVGLCRYQDGFTSSPGFSFHQPGYDSHYVAFSTDRRIDELLEADVFYTKQQYKYTNPTIGSTTESFGELVDSYAYLKGEKVSVEVPGGLLTECYDWETIQTPEEFFTYEDRENIYDCGVFNTKIETKLTDEGKRDIEGQQWILRFALTKYSDYYSQLDMMPTTETHHIEYTIVGNVSIMRLRFITNGEIYDLGVIDNKQQGDGIPDNYTKTSFELKDTFKILLLLLLIIILIVVLAPILPTIINIVLWVIKTVFKIVWWIISLSFKLFKKRE